MSFLPKILEYASKYGITEGLTLLIAVVLFLIVWKDIQKREKERCYYRFKADFDQFRNRQDHFTDRIDEVISALKLISKDLDNVVDMMKSLSRTLDKFSRSSDDATSNMKLKFEEILHKVETLSITIDKILYIFAKLNKDGEI